MPGARMSEYTPPERLRIGSKSVELKITGQMRDRTTMEKMVDAVFVELETYAQDGRELPDSISIKLPSPE